MLSLADLSFRGNADAVQRHCRLQRELDELGNPIEVEEREEGHEHRDDEDDEVLSTASDADLVLPDRHDSSGLSRAVKWTTSIVLVLLLVLKAGQERHTSLAHPKEASFNAYRVLDVPRDASQAEIRTAFRGKARQFHPDSCEGDVLECTEAYNRVERAAQILRNARERKAHDAALPVTWDEASPVVVAVLAVLGAVMSCSAPRGRDATSEEQARIERARRKALKAERFAELQARRHETARRRWAARVLQARWAKHPRGAGFAARLAKALEKENRERVLQEQARRQPGLVMFALRLVALTVVAQAGKAAAQRLFPAIFGP